MESWDFPSRRISEVPSDLDTWTQSYQIWSSDKQEFNSSAVCDVDWCYVRDLKQIIRFYLQSKIFQDRYHQQRLETGVYGGGTTTILYINTI